MFNPAACWHQCRVPDDKPIEHPTFAQAFRFWLKLGFISFGGPTGQIAIMHAELVDKRKWISDTRFLHALNYCMLLPGPEATQLATYIGWLLHRTWGGIVAGVLFVLPSAIMLWALSWTYVAFGRIAWVNSVFYGLKPAVVAIVAAAVIRIGQRALKNEFSWAIAGLAFVAIYFFKVPFPIIILAAAAIGWIANRIGLSSQRSFPPADEKSTQPGRAVIGDETEAPAHAKPSFGRAIRILAVCLVLWWGPVALLGAWLGWDHTVPRAGIFFSKAAMVTFGGAYAVLPYVSQQAVEKHQWLDAGQMLDGLGLAETTPGPLIMVLQFVGFLAGWQHPGTLPSLGAATLGAFITTWTTFVPCFLWILLGAPHIERLRDNARINASLSAVTAAVVGVVLNLAVWFGLGVLHPAGGGLDWFAVVLGAIVFVGLARWKWDVVLVVLGAGTAGLIWRALV